MKSRVVLFLLFQTIQIFVVSAQAEDNITASATWERIKAIELNNANEKLKGLAPSEFDHSLAWEYWFKLQAKCQAELFKGFDEACKKNCIEQFAKDYASYFSKSGSRAGVRWALACPALATHDSIITFPEEMKFKLEFVIFAKEFNKRVTQNSLLSEKYLHHGSCLSSHENFVSFLTIGSKFSCL